MISDRNKWGGLALIAVGIIQKASTESMKGMVSKGRCSEHLILVPSIENIVDPVV